MNPKHAFQNLGVISALAASTMALRAQSLPCPLFDPPISYPAGSGARAVGVADFNADGKPDLAVANFGEPTLSVLLGSGDGTFQDAVNLAIGSGATDLAVGDFDADGNPDIVVANYYSANLSVVLGNGDGTFQGGASVSGGPDPIGLAVGDINNDLKLDVVTASFYGSVVSVGLGQGDGGFAAPYNLGGVTYPAALTVGDFNSDGNLDLAVVNYQAGVEQPLGDGVSVMLGNGDGTFQTAVTYAAGLNPRDVVTGDFNGDGQTDLAVANLAYFNATGSTSVLLGDGAGSFSSPINNHSVGSHPIALVVGDFDADGRSDLAVANSGTPGVPTPETVSVLLGNGDGTFLPGGNYPGGVSPQSLATGDFDGDAKLDLAVASSGDGTVQVLLAYDCNSAPVALCRDVIVSAGADGDCVASASVDNGSYDPDPGDLITITQSPEGPYPLGDTEVTLTVTDALGASSFCTAIVTVVDTTPPVVASAVTTSVLSPVNLNLVNVGLSVTTSDDCGGNELSVDVKVYSDEDDVSFLRFSPDAKDPAAGALRLRADRDPTQDGRVYLIVSRSKDAYGNTGFSSCTVVVPSDRQSKSLASVSAQAAAAKAYCDSHDGAPPTQYFLVGDGPVLGAKQ